MKLLPNFNKNWNTVLAMKITTPLKNKNRNKNQKIHYYFRCLIKIGIYIQISNLFSKKTKKIFIN